MLWMKHTKGNRGDEASSRRDRRAQDAAMLWQRIREPEDYNALSDSSGASTQTLGDISDAVRDALATEAEALAPATARSFQVTHGRLMEAIAASAPARPARTYRMAGASWWGAAWFRPVARNLALAAVLIAAVMGGHRLGEVHSARAMPVQKLVDDFDEGLKSPAPFELVADNSKTTETWLSQSLGMRVRLPAPQSAGVKLLGARRHHLADRPVAQTHYLKGNVRVALYQMHAPRMGLNDMDEVQVNGRSFFWKNCGPYRAIVWRAGDNIMTLVSPLAMRESLDLASAMRESTIRDTAQAPSA